MRLYTPLKKFDIDYFDRDLFKNHECLDEAADLVDEVMVSIYELRSEHDRLENLIGNSFFAPEAMTTEKLLTLFDQCGQINIILTKATKRGERRYEAYNLLLKLIK